MILPTTSTSTECSKTITTSSVNPATSSVIVAPQTSSLADSGKEPTSKRVKTDEETPESPIIPNNQFLQILAQMGGLSGIPPPNQKQVNENQEMMLGQLFPQSLDLSLLFSSPIAQEFPGMQDFETLSALSTPNKGQGVKRQYSSNGKNYCDICNKEVCNKYFLRTHMLKMHGIVIDENKTVIANIDTSIKEREGELTFRCDTCRTMFNTRNQLRQHRQDVHGVVPPSTPRVNRPSVPLTPNGNSNNSRPNSASLADEIGSVGVSNGTTDLTHVLSMINQTATPKREEKDLGSLFKCAECSYKTTDSKNLDLHLERHYKMTDAKSRDENEDVALKLTTEAALRMFNQKEGAIRNQYLDRNSFTSGSISPASSNSEVFEPKVSKEKEVSNQNFLIRCKDDSGEFLTEFIAQLPVRSVIDGPRKIVFDLLPAPTNP